MLLLGEQPVAVAVTQSGSPDAPELHVTARGVEPELETAAETSEILAALLTWMLGLDVDLTQFYRFAAQDRGCRNWSILPRPQADPLPQCL